MNARISTAIASLALAISLTATEFAAAQTVVRETVTTNSAGTVSEFVPGTIVVRSEAASAPVRYSYSKTTTYVDETGAPVSVETVKTGLPVTVYYRRVGNRNVATKVVVRKPVVMEEKTTTTTTTTTSKER